MKAIRFNKEKNDNQQVLVPKKGKNKLPLWIFIAIPSLLLALVLIIGGTVLFNNYQEKKAMEESFKTLQEALNVNITTEKKLLTIEAAPEVTYSPSSSPSLTKVPDQLRNLITSYTGDSDITTSLLDISTVGDKQVTLTITKSDRFGQVAQKEEKVIVTVVDTQEPQVSVVSEVINAKTQKEVEENVLHVYDPVFGPYSYSSMLENHTYRVELPKLTGNYKEGTTIFDVPGCYQAKIVINDSGNIIERLFDVNVGEENYCVIVEEEAPTQEEGENVQIETDENSQNSEEAKQEESSENNS